MAWVFIVLGSIAVVVVGLVVVGRVTAELAARPPVATIDLEEAVLWVGDRLPAATTAEVSYDDVRVVLGWYLDYLFDKGVARSNDAGPPTSGPLVADEDEASPTSSDSSPPPGTPLPPSPTPRWWRSVTPSAGTSWPSAQCVASTLPTEAHAVPTGARHHGPTHEVRAPSLAR